MTQTWYIFSPNGNPPRAPHYSKHEAVKEAERLSKKEPHKEFWVLKLVATVNAEINTLVKDIAEEVLMENKE